MKKFALLLLTCILTLSLCACGGNTQQTAQSTAGTTSGSSDGASSTVSTEGLPPKPDDFPTSTITCIVGFSAGGGVDTAARLLLKYAQCDRCFRRCCSNASSGQ